MNKLIIFFLFIAFVNLQEIQNTNDTFVLYQMFLQKYSKVYTNNQELEEKYHIFQENYNKLQEILNDSEDDGLDEDDKLKLDITDLFDITDEEFAKIYLNFNATDDDIRNAQTPSNDTYAGENQEEVGRHLQYMPSKFDWRDRGVVTPVKSQGYCGACYAFAVAGNIESLYAIKYGSLLNLSEQQIVNCDSRQKGCNGGNIGTVYNYVKRAGLGLESSMKYAGRKQACYAIETKAKILGMKYAGSINEDYIQSFLIKYGPLAVAVNGNYFKYYRGGIMNYSLSQCSPYNLNHAVIITGYGVTSTGLKYWIVKNSYGPRWGENGYIRIARGVCGINRYVMSGIIA